MSITTMTNQEKATQNPAATEAPVKTEVAHWLNKKDENTFKIKQALTFLHFISLLGTAIVYMAHAERYQARAVILSFGTFVLAFCIPPIGMIAPEDAPDATRKALGWMPERGDLNELKKELVEEEESGAGKKKGKGNNKKKKGGKKND
mmetsp:Transcript_6167/g.9251  ORF Transcript_6167/g.9251 Transcript_6167/m.9251 type:complete len:148 (-) Transcript_6167:189-632(-)